MNLKNSRKPALVIATAVAAFSSRSILAQDTTFAPASPPLVQASVDTSYTGGGKTHFEGSTLRNSDDWNINLGVKGRAPVDDQWSALWELSSQNSFLTAVSGTPVPDQINTLKLGAGVGYRLNDEWNFSAVAGPEFYKFDDVRASDLGVIGAISAVWQARTNVTAFFGLLANPNGRVPVFPAVGADWRINREWELSLFFPQPKVIYHWSDRLSFNAGASAQGDVFRTGSSAGSNFGQTRYNDALGNYYDIRVGAGTGWKLCRNASVEVEGGYSVFREIDFQRIHEHVRFDDAPYVLAALKLRF